MDDHDLKWHFREPFMHGVQCGTCGFVCGIVEKNFVDAAEQLGVAHRKFVEAKNG